MGNNLFANSITHKTQPEKKIFIFHSILDVGSCILTGIRRKTSGSQLGNWILWSLFNFPARWTDYIYTHRLTMPRDLEAEANWSRTVQAHVYTKGLSLQNRLACPSHPAGIIPELFSQPKLCFANFLGKTKAGKGQTRSDMGDCMLGRHPVCIAVWQCGGSLHCRPPSLMVEVWIYLTMTVRTRDDKTTCS